MTASPGSNESFENLRRANLQIDELVITIIMARVTDYFGFFVYAIASVVVFPKVFFPHYELETAILLSFGIFSLAFLARPVSSFLFRYIERSIGRTGKVAIALLILGASSMAVGLIPGYDSIGVWAPVILIVMRILQGVGLGGAWDGLNLILQSNAPLHRKGWYAMIPQLGAPIGFCVAASIFYVLTGFLTEEEFVDWGWRWPFFAVLAVNLVSLFARIQLIHSKSYNQLIQEVNFKPAPYVEVLRAHWKDLWMATFLPLASYALLHMMTVFPLAYNYLNNPEDINDFILLLCLGGVACLISVVVSGPLSDRFGRRKMLAIVSTLIGVFSLLVSDLVNDGLYYVMIGYILLGLSYGQASAVLPNRFKQEYRYTGSALATNFSWIFGAAFAPLIATGLTLHFGLFYAGLYLLSGAAVTLVALVMLTRSENHMASSDN